VVHPVHKKGMKNDPANKRPVSLTSVACKLFESCIVQAIYDNANAQDLISGQQFAYRPGLSTVLQLLDSQNDWASLTNYRSPFDVIYFDFKSAFESVTHTKLLNVLPSYGIGSKVLGWIAAFLRNRTFSVKVNDALSSSSFVSSGCPQGTLLGCLMYILYTDSLKFVFPPEISVKVYADDVKIYTSVKDDADRIRLQRALDRFIDWSDSLDLCLSIGKCAVVHFGHGNPCFQYALRDAQIATSSIVKDLGVYITSDFKFTEHCRQTALKANRMCNFILRSFVLDKADVYFKLFDTYVMPLLTYACPVWHPKLKKDLELLERIQSRFTRRVCFRSNVCIEDIDRPKIIDIFKHHDANILKRLLNDVRFTDRFFEVRVTITRREVNLVPKAIARSELINNLFAWRVARSHHSTASSS